MRRSRLGAADFMTLCRKARPTATCLLPILTISFTIRQILPFCKIQNRLNTKVHIIIPTVISFITECVLILITEMKMLPYIILQTASWAIQRLKIRSKTQCSTPATHAFQKQQPTATMLIGIFTDSPLMILLIIRAAANTAIALSLSFTIMQQRRRRKW